MSDLNYITEMLELKDKNIKFFENCESLVKMSLLKNKIISKNVPKYINLKKDSNN